MLIGNLLSLVTIIYFAAVILAIYQLQQKEIDRIQQQIDENNCLLDELQRQLKVQSTT
jgi:cell division protein FtsL